MVMVDISLTVLKISLHSSTTCLVPPTSPDVIIVRKQAAAAEFHRDTLQWLVLHNKYYDDVIINHDTVEQLP